MPAAPRERGCKYRTADGAKASQLDFISHSRSIAMLLLALSLLSTSLVGCASGSFSLFLPERLPQYTHQQDSSSVYWPDTSQSQDYDEDGSFRYQHSYQSSYRQQVQSVPYTTSYPNTVYQQLPPSSIPTYQLSEPSPVVPSGPSLLPGSIPTANLPTVYQIVTIGPEVPVLVRLPNQQTAILPVRTVYSLPSFLERIVQRVQNYYSVYNPLEVLKIPRANETEPVSGDSNTTTTAASPVKASSPAPSSSETTTPKVVTLSVFEVSPTTAEPSEETTTDSNSVSTETTTVE